MTATSVFGCTTHRGFSPSDPLFLPCAPLAILGSQRCAACSSAGGSRAAPPRARSFGVAGSGVGGGSARRRALLFADSAADPRRARDVRVWPPLPSGRFPRRRGLAARSAVLHLTELREFKKGTAAPGCFPAPSQTPCQSAQRCVGPCASVATFVCKNPVTLPFFDEDPCPPRERNLQKWLLLGDQAGSVFLVPTLDKSLISLKAVYWKLGRDAGDFNCNKVFIQGGFK